MAHEPTTAVGYLVGIISIVGWVACIWGLAVSVIRRDPRVAWYDRLIRAIGVLILGATLLFGIPYWFGLVDYWKV